MNKKTLYIMLAVMIIIGIMGRMLPHLPNATPITALAVTGSIYFGRRIALILPLCILFVTDLFIGFYSISIMVSVYGSFLLIALASWWLQKHQGIFSVMYTLVGSSITFFLITNTAVWWVSPWYEKSVTGLMHSYVLGLPFLRNMFIGDMVYTYTLLSAFVIIPYIVSAHTHIFATNMPAHISNS